MALQTIYHVFTDHRDEWMDTEEEGRKVFNQWKEYGYENIRLYSATEDTDSGDIDREDYIDGIGDWPY